MKVAATTMPRPPGGALPSHLPPGPAGLPPRPPLSPRH